eukprot:g65620.t1
MLWGLAYCKHKQALCWEVVNEKNIPSATNLHFSKKPKMREKAMKKRQKKIFSTKLDFTSQGQGAKLQDKDRPVYLKFPAKITNNAAKSTPSHLPFFTFQESTQERKEALVHNTFGCVNLSAFPDNTVLCCSLFLPCRLCHKIIMSTDPKTGVPEIDPLTGKPKTPFVKYCDENPESPECRVYED